MYLQKLYYMVLIATNLIIRLKQINNVVYVIPLTRFRYMLYETKFVSVCLPSANFEQLFKHTYITSLAAELPRLDIELSNICVQFCIYFEKSRLKSVKRTAFVEIRNLCVAF